MYIPNPNRYQKCNTKDVEIVDYYYLKFHLVYGIILETIATMIT